MKMAAFPHPCREEIRTMRGIRMKNDRCDSACNLRGSWLLKRSQAVLAGSLSYNEFFKIPKSWNESWQTLWPLSATRHKSFVNHQTGHGTRYGTGFSIQAAHRAFPSLLVCFPYLGSRFVELATTRHDQIDQRDATNSPERISPVDETNILPSNSNITRPEVPMHNGGRKFRKRLRQFAKEGTSLFEKRYDPLEVIMCFGCLLTHRPSTHIKRLLLETISLTPEKQ